MKNKRGVVLFLVLSLVGVLVFTFFNFTASLSSSLNQYNYWKSRKQLRILSHSFLQILSYLLKQNSGDSLSLTLISKRISKKISLLKLLEQNLDWNLKLEDEEGKVNLNHLFLSSSQENKWLIAVLKRLLKKLKLPSRILSIILDSLDKDKISREEGTEKGAFNRKFRNILELYSLPGISRENVDKLLPFVTIYGKGKINVNTASAIVVESLLEEIDKDDADSLLAYRKKHGLKGEGDLTKIEGWDRFSLKLVGKLKTSSFFWKVKIDLKKNDIIFRVETILNCVKGVPELEWYREY